MQVQNMVWAPAILTVLTAVANIPINMLLISWRGFWGAALATSVARILQLLLLCGEPNNFLRGAGVLLSRLYSCQAAKASSL